MSTKNDERRAPSDYPGTPLWVKLFALATIAVIAVVLLVVVVGTAVGVHTPMDHAR